MSESTEQNLIDSPEGQKDTSNNPPVDENIQYESQKKDQAFINQNLNVLDGQSTVEKSNFTTNTINEIENVDLLGEMNISNQQQTAAQNNLCIFDDSETIDVNNQISSSVEPLNINLIDALELGQTVITSSEDGESQPRKDSEDPDQIEFMDDPYRFQLERTMDLLQYEITKRQKIEAVEY